MARNENIALVLGKLIELTDQLCNFVEHDEIDRLLSTLESREQLLDQETAMVQQWREALSEGKAAESGMHELRPKFEALKQLDEKFVTLFSSKRVEIAQQLKQAQNEKLLLAYSQ